MNLSRLGDRVATRPGGINKTIRTSLRLREHVSHR